MPIGPAGEPIIFTPGGFNPLTLEPPSCFCVTFLGFCCKNLTSLPQLQLNVAYTLVLHS